MTNTHTLPLHELLRATAQDLAAKQPPDAAAAATLAAMQRALPRPAPAAASAQTGPAGWWAGWRQTLALSGAVSFAVLLLGAALLLARPPLQRASGPAVVAATDFVPVVSAERWAGYLQASESKGSSGGQDATAWIVSTEIQGERLALLGLPYDPSQAGERVRAELLMHESGDVLAVRIVR